MKSGLSNTATAVEPAVYSLAADVNDWVSVLEKRAAMHPDKTAFTFLEHMGIESGRCTYEELHSRARKVAAFLQSGRLLSQQVLLFYPQGMGFLEAYFGAIYARGTPVPAFAPTTNRNNMHRLEAIIEDSRASCILADAESAKLLRTWSKESASIAKLEIVETDSLPDTATYNWIRPSFAADDNCFLQYTSGSTGTPKGVMVTHRNLVKNAQLLQTFYQTHF